MQEHAAKKGMSPGLVVIVAIIALIMGMALGYGVIGKLMQAAGLGPSTGTVAATLAEADLDTTIVGSYTYKGKTNNITAREAIVDSGLSIDKFKTEDGNYITPAPELIISVARDRILDIAVKENNIEITDEDAEKFMHESLSLDSYAEAANLLQSDEERAKTVVKRAASYDKLQKQIVGDAAPTKTMPVPPAQPADGSQDAESPEYGAYIADLLGDNWDKANETWTNKDNPFYQAMAELSFTSKSAKYSDATIAYYVGASIVQSDSAKAAKIWNDFRDELYKQGSVESRTLLTPPSDQR